jgi:hypothetical protein
MLLTGLMGQVGHAWAHDVAAGAQAWRVAMQAEADWLASSTPEASPDVLVVGQHRHSPGDAPHGHDGPDGHAADHAHGVTFLAPTTVSIGPPVAMVERHPMLVAPHVSSPASGPDRPPRAV